MEFRFTNDADAFAAAAGAFLAERIERNLLATVLVNVRSGRITGDAPPTFAYAPGAGAEQVLAVAMRTPPWPLLCTALDDAQAAALMAAWLEREPGLSALNAPAATARALAAAWERISGRPARCRMREAMHVLTQVSDPADPPPGRLRPARADELELLAVWEREFVAEAGVVPGDPAATVRSRLEREAQYVWDDDGAVSTLACSPVVAGTARIGPVYTPPARRRRGYATAAVAAVCRLLLHQGGASRCALFTDLANPTSNKIYAAVGFVRIADWEEHALGPLGAAT